MRRRPGSTCRPRAAGGRAGPAGARASRRAGVEAEVCPGSGLGQEVVPGEEFAFDLVDACSGSASPAGRDRRRTDGAEVVERRLRQVVEETVTWPVLRVRVHRADQLRVDPGAVERPGTGGTGCRASVRRCRSSRRAARRAPECRSEGPDLRVVGAFRRRLGPEVGLGVAAGGLPVGRVRVDRQARRQGHDRRPRAARRAGDWPRNCGALRSMSRPDARVGLVGRQVGEEDRFEGLFLAARVAG